MTPFVELAAEAKPRPPAEPTEVDWPAPGIRFAEGCGGDVAWDCLTPLTPVWTRGGGGRFILWAWVVGWVIAVAMVPGLDA